MEWLCDASGVAQETEVIYVSDESEAGDDIVIDAPLEAAPLQPIVTNTPTQPIVLFISLNAQQPSLSSSTSVIQHTSRLAINQPQASTSGTHQLPQPNEPQASTSGTQKLPQPNAIHEQEDSDSEYASTASMPIITELPRVEIEKQVLADRDIAIDLHLQLNPLDSTYFEHDEWSNESFDSLEMLQVADEVDGEYMTDDSDFSSGNTEKMQECPICYENLFDKEPRRLPCGHYVCSDCLYEWYHINHDCPLCRAYIPHKRCCRRVGN